MKIYFALQTYSNFLRKYSPATTTDLTMLKHLPSHAPISHPLVTNSTSVPDTIVPNHLFPRSSMKLSPSLTSAGTTSFTLISAISFHLKTSATTPRLYTRVGPHCRVFGVLLTVPCDPFAIHPITSARHTTVTNIFMASSTRL